jgi:hypothetical protein
VVDGTSNVRMMGCRSIDILVTITRRSWKWCHPSDDDTRRAHRHDGSVKVSVVWEVLRITEQETSVKKERDKERTNAENTGGETPDAVFTIEFEDHLNACRVKDVSPIRLCCASTSLIEWRKLMLMEFERERVEGVVGVGSNDVITCPPLKA